MTDIDKILAFSAIAVFILVVIFGGVISVVLNYHWTRYGIEQSQIKKIKSLYFGVAGVLFIIMTATLLFTL